jgi:hypothetical protein
MGSSPQLWAVPETTSHRRRWRDRLSHIPRHSPGRRIVRRSGFSVWRALRALTLDDPRRNCAAIAHANGSTQVPIRRLQRCQPLAGTWTWWPTCVAGSRATRPWLRASPCSQSSFVPSARWFRRTYGTVAWARPRCRPPRSARGVPPGSEHVTGCQSDTGFGAASGLRARQ